MINVHVKYIYIVHMCMIFFSFFKGKVIFNSFFEENSVYRSFWAAIYKGLMSSH